MLRFTELHPFHQAEEASRAITRWACRLEHASPKLFAVGDDSRLPAPVAARLRTAPARLREIAEDLRIATEALGATPEQIKAVREGVNAFRKHVGLPPLEE